MPNNKVNLINDFLEHGYIDITTPNDALQHGLDIKLLYDYDESGELIKPEELYGLFLSKHSDELFFVLNADHKNISQLCSSWDHKSKVFSNFGSTDKFALRKLMYNMVQLILYVKHDNPEKTDHSIERSLDTTRKIMIPCSITPDRNILIEETDAVEIPFHLVKEETIQPDQSTVETLHDLMPQAGDEVEFLLQPQKSGKRKQHKQKNFDDQVFDAIKGWLI